MRAGFEQLIFVEFCHFQSSVLKQQGMKQMLKTLKYYHYCLLVYHQIISQLCFIPFHISSKGYSKFKLHL
jgi:hypothetical protein